jgi:glutamate-1-semialdehyde 2,1-aminomutase
LQEKNSRHEKFFARELILTRHNTGVTQDAAMKASLSEEFFARATKVVPGGVNSPVRAWKSVGGGPRFIDHAVGPMIFDVDGVSYVDFVGSWGALILGHAHPAVVGALRSALDKGTTFGAPTRREMELAEIVCDRVKGVEKVRLVSSGTEAAMSAVRLARAFTGRDKVIKFDGCYHGHADGLLARAGSGVATLGLPDSPGVPRAFANETLVLAYNDLAGVEGAFQRHPDQVAAIIVEPVCGNMGVIPPAPGFLAGLRRLTQRNRALLIFDEVITGFRLAAGGAAEFYEVVPDLTCMGKVLGGGLPLAAFGGRREVMSLLAPEGPVYQAGTLTGNPLAVTAGLATLGKLSAAAYRALEEKSDWLARGLRQAIAKHALRAVVNRVGSMISLFFGVDEVRNAAEARSCDTAAFARFFHGMLERGIYLPPSPFETLFVSLAHGDAELERTVEAFADWAAREGAG